jgi:hypothetical protein
MRHPHCSRNGSWLPRPPVTRRPQMSAPGRPAVEGTDVQINPIRTSRTVPAQLPDLGQIDRLRERSRDHAV